MSVATVVSLERLKRVDYEKRDFLLVEDTQAAAEWVRSLGHEAASVEPNGFRYRSVFKDSEPGPWFWVEAGEWIEHRSGDNQEPEFDMPSSSGPEGLRSWDGHWIEASE